MNVRNFFIVVFFYCVISFVSKSTAVETSLWETETLKDFEKGQPTDVSLRSDGRIVLSSTLELIHDTGELYVWCLAEDARGNIYLGTGNNGKIFKVTGDGQGTLFFDSPELEILSMAFDAKGTLFAGTAPDGIIYSIGPKGEASTFAETGEAYVWDLLFDTDGSLYAGTGTGGKILRINPAGEIETVYDSKETHIMTLALDAKKNLYAGSEGNGLVYRISPGGDVFVLYDAPQKEIHSLLLNRDGRIYAGATEAVVYVTKAPVPRERSNQGNHDSEGPSESQSSDAVRVGMEKSVVYEISPDGIASRVWSSPSLLLSLAAREDGTLIIGTGDEGSIYSVLKDQTSLALTAASESQILSTLRDRKGRLLLGTGNMGKVFKLTSDYATEGTFESEVHDTETISRWGKISWEADLPQGTFVSLSTRSGNSETPDDTWSDWSKKYERADGATIVSPPARFIQWRATLKTSSSSLTPVLKKISVASLQQNLPPEIMEVTVLSPGKKTGRAPLRPPSKPGEGPPNSKSNSSLRSVEWKSADPNGDQLVHTVSFRGTDETTWKMLTDDESGASYSWDTESVPDGMYLIKVTASDLPANPPSSTLTFEKISDPFVVDNTPPRVLDVKALPDSKRQYKITGRAEDAAGAITSAEYSIDAGDWTMVFPEDDIFDSKAETFSFTIDTPSPGEHTLVIRVTDSTGNIGAGKVVFTVE